MEIGIFSNVAGTGNFEALVADVQASADAGFASYWLSQIIGQVDAMTLIGAVAQQVPSIRFGTSVVPTYPRHPMVMAEQAKTTGLLSGDRFTLGIGLSHQVVVEGMWGYSFDKPVRHAREYLAALMPLLRGEAVNMAAETITVRGQVTIDAAEPPVLLAALGPQMLRSRGRHVRWHDHVDDGRLHARLAHGADDHEAAAEAGRPAPEIAAGFPIWVTDDVDAAREVASRVFMIYGQLPSYRAMLDHEGLAGPEDLAIIGNEATCADRLDELVAAGVTQFAASEFADDNEGRARTRAFLASRL